MFRSLALVPVLSITAAQQATAVPVQWGGNGHWYEPVAVGEFISWDDANQAATDAGGYLVTITSAEENDFVFSLIDSDEYWTDRGTKGQMTLEGRLPRVFSRFGDAERYLCGDRGSS